MAQTIVILADREIYSRSGTCHGHGMDDSTSYEDAASDAPVFDAFACCAPGASSARCARVPRDVAVRPDA